MYISKLLQNDGACKQSTKKTVLRLGGNDFTKGGVRMRCRPREASLPLPEAQPQLPSDGLRTCDPVISTPKTAFLGHCWGFSHHQHLLQLLLESEVFYYFKLDSIFPPIFEIYRCLLEIRNGSFQSNISLIKMWEGLGGVKVDNCKIGVGDHCLKYCPHF